MAKHRNAKAMYAKLFADIRQSSIWAEDSDTRIVWITLLTMADKDGLVRARATGVSIQSRVPLAKVRAALKLFQEPDPDSRSKEHDGRRIEEIDDGYLVLNYPKYRDCVSEQDRREKAAERQKRFRERKKAENRNKKVTQRNAPVTQSNDIQIADVYAVKSLPEKPENGDGEHPPTENNDPAPKRENPEVPGLVRLFCATCGWPKSKTQAARDEFTAKLALKRPDGSPVFEPEAVYRFLQRECKPGGLAENEYVAMTPWGLFGKILAVRKETHGTVHPKKRPT